MDIAEPRLPRLPPAELLALRREIAGEVLAELSEAVWAARVKQIVVQATEGRGDGDHEMSALRP